VSPRTTLSACSLTCGRGALAVSADSVEAAGSAGQGHPGNGALQRGHANKSVLDEPLGPTSQHHGLH